MAAHLHTPVWEEETRYPNTSQVQHVAALKPGEGHWNVKEAGNVKGDATAIAKQIDVLRRSLASAATKTIQRVTAKHPKRKFETMSAVCIASNGRLFVGMMIERTDAGAVGISNYAAVRASLRK